MFDKQILRFAQDDRVKFGMARLSPGILLHDRVNSLLWKSKGFHPVQDVFTLLIATFLTPFFSTSLHALLYALVIAEGQLVASVSFSSHVMLVFNFLLRRIIEILL